MPPTTIGHEAERMAAQHLLKLGYRVIQLNWKTPRCEIDIVAEWGGIIYFIECKYRRTSVHGSGLDYITTRKLRQMQFAARLWIEQHGWCGPTVLGAIELSGLPPRVDTLIPIIST